MKRELNDIAILERAKANEMYEAGTVYVQVSATNGQVHILEEPACITASKYVIVTPKIEILPMYLYYMIWWNMDEFRHTYQTGLNIKTEELKKLKLDVISLKEQQYIVEQLEFIEDLEKQSANELKFMNEFKDKMLDVLFV